MRKIRLIIITIILLLLSCSPVFASDVAKIGKKHYSTLQSAVNHANNGDVIVLLRTVSTKKSVKINKNVVIDFANKKYSFPADGDAFIVNSTVTFKRVNLHSSSGGIYTKKKGKVDIKSGTIIGSNTNYGTLIINGGKYSGAGCIGDILAPAIENYGTLKIKKGTFTGKNHLVLWNYGKTTIDGGSFSTNKCSTIDNLEGTLKINGGSFKNSPKYDDDYLIGNYANTVINQGTFRGFIYNETKGNKRLQINGGTFRGVDKWVVICNHSGNVNISNGSFATTEYNTIFNEKKGLLNVTGGKFLTKSQELYYCIYNEGRLIASGGVFKTNNDTKKSIGCTSTSEWWVTGSAKGIVEERE